MKQFQGGLHALLCLVLALLCCDGNPCPHSAPGEAQLLSQLQDQTIGLVAKVLEKGSSRMLVIAGGQDFTAPCDYVWWMSHEVQGEMECVSAKTSPSPAPSFLQRSHQAGPATSAVCPSCTPNVDKLRGYFQSMAAFSVLDIWGKPRRPGRALVIGLGAGLLPSWLAARTDATVDIVDYSSAVVSLAPCFGIQAGPRTALHIEDGRKFLAEAPTGSYDTLVVDAFDTHASMPVCMRSVEFFQLAASRLSGQGVLLLNLLKCGSDDDPSSCGKFRAAVVASVQAALPHTFLADAPGSFGSQDVLLARRSLEMHSGGNASSTTGGGTGEEAQQWHKEANLRKLEPVDPKLAAHDKSKC